MNFSVKRIFAFFCIALVFVVASGGALYGFRIYKQATQREVWLQSNPGFPNMPGGPVEVLSAAVGEDRLAAGFHVKWAEVFGTSYAEGELFYNRRASTLIYRGAVRSAQGRGQASFSASHVTDGNLRQAANVYIGDLAATLSKCGCQVQNNDAAANS